MYLYAHEMKKGIEGLTAIPREKDKKIIPIACSPTKNVK